MEKLEIDHQGEHQEAQENRPESDATEEMNRALGIAMEETDQEQIEDHVKSPAKSILGLACDSRAVMDDHLGDPRPLP